MNLREFLMTQVYQTIKAKDYNEERTIEYLTEFIDEIDNVKADVSEQRRVFIRNKRLRTLRRRLSKLGMNELS
jgi:hypothetical protein|tara:strand:+ start:589 stop:807 length:219 start_codon:yes stop_codon:yes gene_type:complete